jgi:hypothetical protein
MIREVVGVFDDATALRSAVDELMLRGVDRSFLSLLAPRQVVERELGRYFERPEEIEDDPAVPRMAYVGTDSRVVGRSACAGAAAYVGAVATAGVVAALDASIVAALAATAAVGGAGAALGIYVGGILDRPRVRDLRQQVEHGGIPLWIRVPTAESETIAVETLREAGARHVHVHELTHEAASTEGGVSQYFAWIDKPLPAWLTGRRAATEVGRH